VSFTSSIKKAVLRAAPTEECRTCLYFYFKENPNAAIGSCHRYPEPRQSPAAYWCGEWKIDPDESNAEKG
jgi:hypothetical protein